MARILVIDDDESLRKMLGQMLVKAGHEVRLARDGREGVLLFRQGPADLVITDILMPEKEGIETILELRREYPQVKILAISRGGTVDPGTYLNMARDLGADRTLGKPFSWSRLDEVLKELL
ncbi:MAG: response regulator [Thermodesulfobacteriota bacterium]